MSDLPHIRQEDLDAATAGLYPYERPMSAGIVSVCPKCSAYVADAKAHKRWHRKHPRWVKERRHE